MKPILLALALLAFSSVAAAPAEATVPLRSASTTAGPLRATIRPGTGHIATGRRTVFLVTVTSTGAREVAAGTLTIGVSGRLAGLRVVAAPPASLTVSCAPGTTTTTAGSGPGVGACEVSGKPPCQTAAAERLVCDYSSWMLGSSGRGSLEIFISARATRPGRARLVAHISSPAGSAQPTAARTVARFEVGR